MAYLDDDDEGTLSADVSNYYFIGADDEPVSFALLPVKWGTYDILYDKKNRIFLRGTTDNGLQKIHKEVKAWTFDLSKPNPQISVLSKHNTWINLLKPRKSYVSEIRTILITLHSLRFFKRQPKASAKPLWDHLSKVFRYYDIKPSEKDLIDHLNFIGQAVKRDITLGRSKFLASLLEESPKKKRAFDKNAESTDDDEYEDCELTTSEDSESDDEDNDGDGDDEDVNDDCCALCDNGGDLTCCDGKCLRAFHATLESAGPNCKSLGLPSKEVKGEEPFFCLNCTHEQHQCFVCGELGSSNKSSGAEVFLCSSTACGHFYHPECVAKLLEDKSDTKAHILQEKIAAGEPFICPAHKCHWCEQGENEKVKGLQFAMCRQCPTSYHRECLPRKIRRWDGLFPKSRLLIYCQNHKIDPKLGISVPNVKFPKNIGHSNRKAAVSEEVLNTDYTSIERRVERPSSSSRPIDFSRKRVTMSSGSEPVKKHRVTNTSKISPRKNSLMEVETPKLDDKRSYTKDDISVEEDAHILDTDSRERIVTIMKEAAASITMDKVKQNQIGRLPSTVEKLEEIVGRLSWYIEDGDTIVDLFCGANDIICLMKKRLDEIGVSCWYKSYDITSPKSEFYFENVDWMNVLSKELPFGSQLIIGLNPPSGKNASLVNRFLDQALLLKPKLIIQFVSPGTKRLDHGDLRTPYDLVWEDAKSLAGKSVYLPGSVEVNEKQVGEWNNNPPALYLWSRPDWSGKHIAVAHRHGHISKEAHENKASLDNHDLRSPEERSQCDNNEPLFRDSRFLDIQYLHKEKQMNFPSPIPYHSRASETPDSDVDFQASCRSYIATRDHYVGATYRGAGVRFPGYQREIIDHHGYIRDGRLDSCMRQRFSAGYAFADPSSYNMCSTSVIQRYAPRLDELNHLWMNSMRGMDAPGPHHPFSHQKSSGDGTR